MAIETIKMSSKGQIVIPQDIRKEINADEGTLFAVVGSKNTIVLKKIETPSKESLIKDLENIAKKGREKAERQGVKEGDIPSLVHKLRQEKRK
ncbi:MAG: AbrB/MazE/SpoVT family DNA-binding domain-containing protein [Nanoarchaeota archaeon]